MNSVKFIASIFSISAAYILLKLILGKEIDEGSNKYVKDFFIEYGDEVALIVMLFLFIMVIADAYGWDFNPPTSKHLDKVVVIEGMSGRRSASRPKKHNHDKHHHHDHHHHHDKEDDEEDVNTDDDMEIDDDEKKNILERGFCRHHRGKSHNLEKACNKLSKTNCMNTNCCVSINGDKCVAGDKHGPTYRTKNRKRIDIDHYYYKNKRYGLEE